MLYKTWIKEKMLSERRGQIARDDSEWVGGEKKKWHTVVKDLHMQYHNAAIKSCVVDLCVTADSWSSELADRAENNIGLM